MSFKKGIDPKKQIGIGRTVLDDLREHPIARPMNDPWNDVDPHKDPNFSVWINPHNQFCFNAKWCTPEILEQWMKGEGPMVKGKTPEEKKKFWDYAVFEAAEDPWEIGHSKWLVKYTWRFHENFVTDFDPHQHGGYGINMKIKKPLKLKSNKTKDEIENKIRTENAIKAMLVPFVNQIVKELEYREWPSVRKEVENDLYGINRTLYCLGYGYMGACNTPGEISNLNWVKDIVFGKAIYLWLKKQNYPLPDFDFLTHSDRSKIDWDEE